MFYEQKNIYDCTDYNSYLCPKETCIKRKINSDNCNFLLVGCWGVYCWDGYVEMKEFKPKKNNFDIAVELFGQKRVVKGMENFSTKTKTEALFLAGDNVYNYNIPKQKLIDIVEQKNYPTKEQYKGDVDISGQIIEKQINEGFLNCVDKIPVKDFFIAIGNHDIQNCHDLNYQLNYNQDLYKLPGLYYNVEYNLKDYDINFLIIDTNMFSKDYKTCNPDIEYSLNDYKIQKKWIINCLKKVNAKWNVIIGHVPYKANGHCEKSPSEFNNYLDKLFNKINTMSEQGNCPPVQIYFCADEHNQQFLYDEPKKLSLVVAGSGGAILDTNIQTDGKYSKITKFLSVNFGFVNFNFTENNVKIIYYKSGVGIIDKKDELLFLANVDADGKLLYDVEKLAD